jgi:hypothetical protein
MLYGLYLRYVQAIEEVKMRISCGMLRRVKIIKKDLFSSHERVKSAREKNYSHFFIQRESERERERICQTHIHICRVIIQSNLKSDRNNHE